MVQSNEKNMHHHQHVQTRRHKNIFKWNHRKISTENNGLAFVGKNGKRCTMDRKKTILYTVAFNNRKRSRKVLLGGCILSGTQGWAPLILTTYIYLCYNTCRQKRKRTQTLSYVHICPLAPF